MQKNCIVNNKNRKRQLPVYKRQQFLLAFIQLINGSATATDLQKLVFLHSVKDKSKYYDFMPYKFGAFSFQLKQDIDVLESNGYISSKGNKIKPLDCACPSMLNLREIETLRGDSLIKRVYKEYPYYAINSEIAERLLNSLELKNLKKVKQQFINSEQILFSIGYEGKTIEDFVNTLIKNDIRLLCDVRKNPISRKFGFSQSRLKYILDTVGIKYKHMPELGIESQKRQKLNSPDDYYTLFKEYKDTLPSRATALSIVHHLLISNNRIALMCYENDPDFCHRKQIKNYILEHYNTKGRDL